MLDVKIKIGQSDQPPGCLSLGVIGISMILSPVPHCQVISPQQKMASYKEMLNKVYHCQQFTSCDAVIALGLGQHLASISNNLFLPILDL